MTLLPGLLVVTLIAAVAYGLGLAVPLIGAPVFAILLGLAVHQFAGLRQRWRPGVTFASKKILQTSIVLLGFTMSLGQVAHIGGRGLPVMLGTLAAALIAGPLVGRALGVETGTRKLIIYGTSICGASAIATMAAVMGSAPSQIAYAIAVILVFNVLGAVLFPLFGHLMGMSQESFGLWAGTAINDTSSVLAAATVYGAAAATYAVIVKLTRTLAIIPMAVGESLVQRRREGGQGNVAVAKLIPPFLVLFVLAAGLRSAGIVPDAWGPALKHLALIGTTLAMAGVGLGSSFSQLKAAGWRPVALGGILWVIIALTSLGLQGITGQL